MKRDNFFLDHLKNIYFVERQILTALPKIAKAVQGDLLKQAFVAPKEETEDQVKCLESVFEALGKPTQGITCEAIKRLIEEREERLRKEKAQFGARCRADSLRSSCRALQDRRL